MIWSPRAPMRRGPPGRNTGSAFNAAKASSGKCRGRACGGPPSSVCGGESRDAGVTARPEAVRMPPPDPSYDQLLKRQNAAQAAPAQKQGPATPQSDASSSLALSDAAGPLSSLQALDLALRDLYKETNVANATAARSTM